MASRTSPGLGLQTEWALGENGWKTGMDKNLLDLSVLVNTGIIDFVTDLPADPDEADAYVVTTGVNAQSIAVFDLGIWKFWVPKPGYQLFNQADDHNYIFNGTEWYYPLEPIDAAVATATEKADDAIEAAALATAAAAGAGEGVAPVDSITVLADLDTTGKQAALVKIGGRAGLFYWDSSNLSAQVAIDTAKGTFVPPSALNGLATDGTQGAWRRQRGPLSKYHKLSEYGDDILNAVKTVALEGGTLELDTRGTVSVDKGFTLPGNVELVGLGRDISVLANTSATFADTIGTYAINAEGVNGNAFGALPGFQNIGIGEFEIRFLAAHGLKVGDVVVICDQGNYSFSGYRSYYWKGWRARVMAVEGNYVYMSHGCPRSLNYNASTCIARKVPSRRGKLGGFTLDCSGAAYNGLSGLHLQYGDNVEMDDFAIDQAWYTGFYLRQCFGMRAERLRASMRERSTFSGNDYGIIVGNSSEMQIQGEFAANWHAASIGGGDENGASHNYKVRFFDSIIRNSFTVMASDIHGNAQDTVYDNCDIDGGIGLAGLNARYQGCRIHHTRGQNNVLVYANELKGGLMELINCDMYTSRDSGSFGQLSLAGSGSGDLYLTEPVYYHVTGGKLDVATDDNIVNLYNASGHPDPDSVISGGATSSTFYPSSLFMDLPIRAPGSIGGEIARARNVFGTGNADYFVIRKSSPIGTATLISGYDATYKVMP